MNPERLSSLPKIILIHITLLIILFTLAHSAAASDDSNSGSLAQIPTIPSGSHYIPSRNATNTISAIDKLSQGSNDTTTNKLIQQLTRDVQTGNNTDAEKTIRDLQSYVKSSNSTGISPTLKDLIQSLTVQKDGVSVDPSALKSLLGDPNQDGVPSNLTNMNPTQVANDLSTLSNLLSGIDRSTASSLALDSQEIRQMLQAIDGPPPSGVVGIPPPPSVEISTPSGGGLAPHVPQISPNI